MIYSAFVHSDLLYGIEL